MAPFPLTVNLTQMQWFFNRCIWMDSTSIESEPTTVGQGPVTSPAPTVLQLCRLHVKRQNKHGYFFHSGRFHPPEASEFQKKQASVPMWFVLSATSANEVKSRFNKRSKKFFALTLIPFPLDSCTPPNCP